MYLPTKTKAEAAYRKAKGQSKIVYTVRACTPENSNEIRMMEHVGDMPNLENSVYTFKSRAREWAMVADLGEYDLHSRFVEVETLQQKVDGLFMELQESLPLLVDLLWAARHLDARGAIHLDLTGENVVKLIPDLDQRNLRAVASDFRSVIHAPNANDASVRGALLSEHCGVSAARLAPEPVGPKQHVWQIGLLFAKMCVGEFPTDTVLRAFAPVDQSVYIGPPGSRREAAKFADTSNAIRHALRGHFSLADDPAFRELALRYPDIAEILMGMLDLDPDTRWTPDDALHMVYDVMANRCMPPVRATNFLGRAIWVLDDAPEVTVQFADDEAHDDDQNLVRDGAALHLRFGDIGDGDTDVISTVLGFARNAKSLCLSFKGGMISDAGAAAIAEALPSLPRLISLELDLEDNGITDVGAAALADALSRVEQLRVLRLRLSGNTIAEDGIDAIAAGLPPTLRGFEFALRGTAASDGVASLLGARFRDSRLLRLDLLLSGNRITDVGAAELAEGVLNGPPLVVLNLDLGENSVTDVGAQVLAKAVQAVPSITRAGVRLEGNDITEAGVAAVKEADAQLLLRKKLMGFPGGEGDLVQAQVWESDWQDILS